MPDKIKFTQEELDNIKDFQKQYMDVQMNFGQSEIIRLRLTTQLEDLDTHAISLEEDFKKIQQEEKTFIDGVNKKYGDGVLDPDTGVFTPKAST